MAEITYGAVLALVRIFQRAAIDGAWTDFMRAYGLRGEGLVPEELPYSGPAKYRTMENLKDLHKRARDPAVHRFFEQLAQATLNELYRPRNDRLGRSGRFWDHEERAQADLDVLLKELGRGGYHVDDDGRLVTEDLAPGEQDIDQVAQIPTRRYLERESDHIVRVCEDAQLPVGAMFVDVDDFKLFNEKYGHQVGDDVLRAVSLEAAAAVRLRGVIGRWGAGDEIVCTLRNMTEGEVAALGERVRTTIAKMEVKGLKVTISVGVASSASRGQVGRLWANADEALRVGKSLGKNRTTRFSQSHERESERSS